MTPEEETTTMVRMQYRHLRRAQAAQRVANEEIAKAQAALVELTGHGPKRDRQGYVLTCICGWKEQGGYPSDKARAVSAHVLREWEKACNDPA